MSATHVWVNLLEQNNKLRRDRISRFLSPPAGVAVLVSPDIPLQLGLDSRQQFCLQSLPSLERLPLQYTVCVAHNVRAAHQEAVQRLSQHPRELPSMKTLRSVLFVWVSERYLRGGGGVEW